MYVELDEHDAMTAKQVISNLLPLPSGHRIVVREKQGKTIVELLDSDEVAT